MNNYSLSVGIFVSVLILLSSGTSLAQNASGNLKGEKVRTPVIYTIQGTKDPRLQATFSATYISTSTSDACSHPNSTTGTRKVNIGRKNYPITEENYRIEIPIYLSSHGNACGYRFSRIELMLRRIYDNELYSRHILLDRKSKVQPIYYGYRTGTRGGGRNPLMPAKLMTDKPHFRIAKQTQYICRTNFYIRRNSTELYCFMQIRDGKADNKFIYPTKWAWATHPEFGIDDLSNEVLQVDLIADDLGSRNNTGKERLQDRFRIPPKPKPSDLERFKDLMNQLFQGL